MPNNPAKMNFIANLNARVNFFFASPCDPCTGCKRRSAKNWLFTLPALDCQHFSFFLAKIRLHPSNLPNSRTFYESYLTLQLNE